MSGIKRKLLLMLSVSMIMLSGCAGTLKDGAEALEAGDYEAEASVQLAGEEQSGHTFERTLYVPNTALEHLIPGRYVDVRVIPGREDLFAIVLDTSVVSGIS